MDKYNDMFINEAPYDRVSNLINENIQSYKTGKDDYFLNGKRDTLNKKEIVDRFYKNLKSELEKTTGSNEENETIVYGTKIGRFLFNNSNDCVEIANSLENYNMSNKLNVKSLTVLKNIISEIFEEIIIKCDKYKKLNMDLSKGISSNDVNFSVTSDMKNNKENVKDFILDRNIDDTLYFFKFDNNVKLKEILNKAFSTIKISNAGYFNRFLNRLNCLNQINSAIMKICDLRLDISKMSHSNILDMNKTIKSKIKYMEKISDPDDIFVFENTKYIFNINTFSIVRKDENFNSRGIFFKDYLYSENNKIKDIPSSDEKICLYSLMSMCESNELKNLLDSNHRVGSGDLKIKKESLSTPVRDIAEDDLSIGDYYSIEENLLELNKSFQKNSENTIESGVRLINEGLTKLKDSVSSALKFVKGIDVKEFNTNSINFALQIMIYGYLGIFSSYEAIELVFAKDIVERHSLSFLINELLSNINYILNQENQNDK